MGGDPVNFSDPFGLCPDSASTETSADCEADSQADGHKDCSAASDNKANGGKQCASPPTSEWHQVAAAQALEPAITVADVVLLTSGAALALKAKALAGMALATETGLGLMDGIRANLYTGDNQAFVPTGTTRRQIVSSGTYLAIKMLKAKYNLP